MKHLLILSLIFSFVFSFDFNDRSKIVKDIDKATYYKYRSVGIFSEKSEKAIIDFYKNGQSSSNIEYVQQFIAEALGGSKGVEKALGMSLKSSISRMNSNVNITSEAFVNQYNIFVITSLYNKDYKTLTKLAYFVSKLSKDSLKNYSYLKSDSFENYIYLLQDKSSNFLKGTNILGNLLKTKQSKLKDYQSFLLYLSLGDFDFVKKILDKQKIKKLYKQALEESFNGF